MIDRYLDDVRRAVRGRGRDPTRIAAEAAAHLEEAIESELARGATHEDAEHLALAALGSPEAVAAEYRPRRRGAWVALAAAVTLGVAIGWVDSGPHWDDTGVTAAGVLLSTAGLGFAQPGCPWRWALAVGACVPLIETVRTGNKGSLAVLVFALAGSYGGSALRRRRETASN